MKIYEGIISIAVQFKAENIKEALQLLDDNPLEFTDSPNIDITSENHDLWESCN